MISILLGVIIGLLLATLVVIVQISLQKKDTLEKLKKAVKKKEQSSVLHVKTEEERAKERMQEQRHRTGETVEKLEDIL